MTTPNVNAKTSKLFFSLVAGSLLVAAPVIVMGCSSSNTAPFQAIIAGPTAITITVAPASLTAVGQTATFTFTLNNATPTALEVPFTTTLTNPSTTTFNPVLPAEGTVTIPAGGTTATLDATVATLPALDTTTTVTLATTILGGATASFTVVGPAAPPPVASVPFVNPVPDDTIGNNFRFFVTPDTFEPNSIRIQGSEYSAQPPNPALPNFKIYSLGGISFPDLGGATQIEFDPPIPALPDGFCAYLAPNASTDPASDAIARTQGCP